MVKLFISKKEYEQRLESVKNKINERGLDALYLSNSNRIFYTTGFHYLASRPQGCLIRTEGDPMFFIPKMEEQRMRENWSYEGLHKRMLHKKLTVP